METVCRDIHSSSKAVAIATRMLFPSLPVCTLTPKVFNFHVSDLVHRYRLWRRCVATYVRHLKWLPWQPGCCFPCSSTILYTPSCSGVYCAHLSSWFFCNKKQHNLHCPKQNGCVSEQKSPPAQSKSCSLRYLFPVNKCMPHCSVITTHFMTRDTTMVNMNLSMAQSWREQKV